MVAFDPKSTEILKPVVRGRDIRRFHVDWKGLWLIDSHNGYGTVPSIDITDYPAVKNHLDNFYARLERRYDKGNTPYNLRNCAYHADFSKEKLLWADMARFGRFAYSAEETYCNNKGYILTGKSLKYLCAILNSSLISWWARNFAATTGMGLTEWTIATVDRLPIPHIDPNGQNQMTRLVDVILQLGEDSKSLVANVEMQIDDLTHRLFGLTDEEAKVISSR